MRTSTTSADLRDNPTRLALVVALALVALAAGGAALLVWGGPLLTAAAVVALAGTLLALRSLKAAFAGLIAVLTLLPFAALPIRIVFRPTFLDVALLGVLALWALDAYGRARQGERVLVPLPGAWPVVAFLLLAVITFIAGLGHAALTSNLLRHFAELLLSVAFFLAAGWYASRPGAMRPVAVALILGGALAALIGIALWLLPDATANRALNAFGVLGYPRGEVVRYIEDNPDLPERAIGTSVDPNVFGGMLTLTTALALPQVFARRRALTLPRWLAVAAAGLGGLCLLLTFSRGAMVGLAAAALFLGVVRYRRLLGALALAGALVLLMPQTQYYVTRFAEGLQNEDLATQMRFGEYKDALRVIERFPVFGVGFAGTPDIDIYLGVSNMYLLLAEEMGLAGLAGFLTILAALGVRAWRARRAADPDDPLEPLWLGLHAALLAALVDGVFDHYFLNLDFHHAVTLFWMLAGLAAAATARLAARRPAGRAAAEREPAEREPAEREPAEREPAAEPVAQTVL
jgi:O-antigen ligase